MAELQITIRFLDPRFHGRGDGGEPEWPPSPMRLFQALLAAGKARWTEELASAFRWLEAQAPPLIHAPRPAPGSARLTYVPNNNTDSPAQLRTAKTVAPTLMSVQDNAQRPEVTYRWSINAGDRSYAQRIIGAARRIRALGWGIDLAIGRGEVIDTPAARAGDQREAWFPEQQDDMTPATTTLRTPASGSLASLEAAYEQSLKRVGPDGTIHDNPGRIVFTPTAYGRSQARPTIAFELCQAENPQTSAPVRLTQIKCLVAMIRSAASSATVARALGENGELLVNQVVLGHPPDAPGPRLSILPLPSIGHPHSDGRIRRVILTESFDGDGRVIGTLGGLLHGHELEPEHPKDRLGARLIRIDQPPRDSVVRRYCDDSKTWASATPVLLPGYDKHKQHRGDQQKRLARAEQLLCKALRHADIQQPAEIELSRVPLIPGTAHVHDYRPREKLSHYPRYHVRLTFNQPVAGPLSIGAGRHVGFGVMAACG